MTHRILVVDDHAVVRKMLKMLIETHEGWEVCSEAANGQDAVAKVAEFNPDVVIMDLAMPIKDGISASREISARAPALPIVMHTLHYSPELELEAKKAGVRAVVPKADSGDELLKTIEAVLSDAPKARGAGMEAPAADVSVGDGVTTPGTRIDKGPSTDEKPPQNGPKVQ